MLYLCYNLDHVITTLNVKHVTSTLIWHYNLHAMTTLKESKTKTTEYDAPGNMPVDFNKARCVDIDRAHHLKATLHGHGPGQRAQRGGLPWARLGPGPAAPPLSTWTRSGPGPM